jgi:transcriptional regulator with XRE-family HTH domain
LISGSELKIKLKQKGIKIQDIIDKYDLNRASVSRYLNDRMAMPATFIIQCAEMADMSIEDFMVKDGKPPTTMVSSDVRIDPANMEKPASVKENNFPYMPEQVIKREDMIFNKRSPLRWLELNTTELEKYILGLESRIEELERKMEEK